MADTKKRREFASAPFPNAILFDRDFIADDDFGESRRGTQLRRIVTNELATIIRTEDLDQEQVIPRITKRPVGSARVFLKRLRASHKWPGPIAALRRSVPLLCPLKET